MSDMDNDQALGAMAAEIEALKGEREAMLREREALVFERRLERALLAADVRKVARVRALLDVEKLEVDERGDFANLSEQLAEIAREAPGFFMKGERESQCPQAGGAGHFARSQAAAGENPWAKGSFNLTKQGEMLRKNPRLAKQLMRQAGM